MIRVQLLHPHEPPQESPFLPPQPQPPQAHCVADKSLMVNTSNFLYAIDYSVLIQMLQKQKNNIRKKKGYDIMNAKLFARKNADFAKCIECAKHMI